MQMLRNLLQICVQPYLKQSLLSDVVDEIFSCHIYVQVLFVVVLLQAGGLESLEIFGQDQLIKHWLQISIEDGLQAVDGEIDTVIRNALGSCRVRI